ncbi:MAG: HAMP domain-containing histidine kinase [Epsilonproteobacteria bacterium]|nr:HAMP domain-containing histidine kinase [Campylobacterota bacterium]
MSVLKNWDINLRQSEKKTLLSFFILYSFFTVLLLLFLAITYYNSQKNLMLKDERLILSKYANKQIQKLKYLHVNFDKVPRIYPRNKKFKSGIYDSVYVKIFSLLDSDKVDLNEDIYLQDDKIYYIKELESYYLGTKYVVIEVKDNGIWKNKVYNNFAIYGTILLSILLLMGYFLMNLILRPMREAISLLDRFIKDTTHELNTPISTILSNIELSEDKSADERLQKRLNRIKIAAKTISNLYQDLVFLTLSSKRESKKEKTNIKRLLEERIEYFSLFFQSKKIVIRLKLEDGVVLYVDKNNFRKLIDNLLSNAIKYNKINGYIEVTLTKNDLCIKNSGRGIERDKLSQVFKRYERADKSVGGFGIGLSIVSKIAEEEGLKIMIDSVYKKFTTLKVSW